MPYPDLCTGAKKTLRDLLHCAENKLGGTARSLFTRCFSTYPEWFADHPRGGSVHNAYKRTQVLAEQLVNISEGNTPDYGTIEQAYQYCADLTQRFTHELNKEKAKKKQAWVDWVDQALDGGCKKAHAWINGPQPWHPQYGTAQTDGAMSTAPKEIINSIAQKCKKLWIDPKAKERRKLLPTADRRAHARLTPQQITKAGRDSAPHKTIAFDGMHPRHYGNMSAQGQEVVAIIWEACEYAS